MERRPQIPNQESFPAFHAGTKLILEKRNIHEGSRSTVQAGGEMSGTLAEDIKVGKSVRFDNDTNTSAVKKMYRKEGKLFIDTQTSTYEILHYRKTEGLNLKNEYGEIELPEDAKEAVLDSEVVDVDLKEGLRVYINKPALKGTLLEVHKGEIFSAMGSRLMVIAKVNNVHIPFYISSQGTSGKRKGEWYPFFGYTGDWLVKGALSNKSGDMHYHPAVTKVQDLLNKNLIIPEDYLSRSGKIGDEYEPGALEPKVVEFDLAQHLKYQNVWLSEYANHDDPDKDFVERITGYHPTKVKNDGGESSSDWIKDIMSRIESN